METRLGKIESVKLGHGGYQSAMLGIHFVLSGKSWSTNYSQGGWDFNLMEHTEYCKWSEEDRAKQYADVMYFISDCLHKAKVDRINRLVGIPIEATFEENTLKEWRVLTEVI